MDTAEPHQGWGHHPGWPTTHARTPPRLGCPPPSVVESEGLPTGRHNPPWAGASREAVLPPCDEERLVRGNGRRRRTRCNAVAAPPSSSFPPPRARGHSGVHAPSACRRGSCSWRGLRWPPHCRTPAPPVTPASRACASRSPRVRSMRSQQGRSQVDRPRADCDQPDAEGSAARVLQGQEAAAA